jgi:RecA-family ATPase
MIEEVEWFDEIAPVLSSAYVIKGLLDQGAMSVVYGPSNSGKTFYALNLAYHAAAGLPWRERRVDAGGVLYLAAEGGNGIANRIVALRQTSKSTNVPLALRRAGLDLLHPEADVQRIIDLAAELTRRSPLRMIVIDTLSRVLAGGDENGPTDMTAFVKNVDAIRLATASHVMVVHHTGKDLARGARGHNSLRAATDTEIEIAVDDFDNRSAKVMKQRDHGGGEQFYFGLQKVDLGHDQDGEAVTSCVLTETEEPAAGDGTPPMSICRLMLKDIGDGWDSGNPLSASHQAGSAGRYAPRFLAQKFHLPFGVVKTLLQSWIDNEVVLTDVVNKKTKKTGLRVLSGL